jgi:GTP-binding protein
VSTSVRRPSGRSAFVAAAAQLERLPAERFPEIALAGRSNVGKSSLLNRLVGQHGLARVSKRPGRTQQINWFDVDGRFMLVDLPGYGFARVPLAVKASWRGLIEGYLRRRQALRGVLLLVDVRRGLEADDLQLLAFLAAQARPVRVIATKIDKLSRGARLRALARLRSEANDAAPMPFSASSGEGVDAIRQLIEEWAGEG